MKISIIAAMTKNGVIGKDNKIPWNYPEDMQWFKGMTMESTVIMGRKTFESMGSRPLEGRNNIIVSTILDKLEYITDNGRLIGFTKNIDEALSFCRFFEFRHVWFIGGYSIYKEAAEIADEMWITQIPDKVEGENLTYFPSIDWSKWKNTKMTCLCDEDSPPYNLFACKYERIKNVE